MHVHKKHSQHCRGSCYEIRLYQRADVQSRDIRAEISGRHRTAQNNQPAQSGFIFYVSKTDRKGIEDENRNCNAHNDAAVHIPFQGIDQNRQGRRRVGQKEGHQMPDSFADHIQIKGQNHQQMHLQNIGCIFADGNNSVRSHSNNQIRIEISNREIFQMGSQSFYFFHRLTPPSTNKHSALSVPAVFP